MTDTHAETFRQGSRLEFARSYPETPHRLLHSLRADGLFTLDALSDLAEALPPRCVEHNIGDLPIGVRDKPAANGRSIGETIRQIATAQSWAVLKNVEQAPAYGRLLHGLLEELRPTIEGRTGALLHPQAFVFISSPNAVTPYHFDPEHNILLQLKGSKVMTQFPAGNVQFADDTTHEAYHTGGPRELAWNEEFLGGGTEFSLEAGEAVYVPVMAPHFVRNGPDPSLSLSITWRSDWSYCEADARTFNALLRRHGLNPAPPRRWPAGNRAKAYATRLLRKVGPAVLAD